MGAKIETPILRHTAEQPDEEGKGRKEQRDSLVRLEAAGSFKSRQASEPSLPSLQNTGREEKGTRKKRRNRAETYLPVEGPQCSAQLVQVHYTERPPSSTISFLRDLNQSSDGTNHPARERPASDSKTSKHAKKGGSAEQLTREKRRERETEAKERKR